MAGDKRKGSDAAEPKPEGVELIAGADVLALLTRGVVALEGINAAMSGLRSYVEANGIPGSLFERGQRALGKAKTIVSVVRLYKRVSSGLGPGERETFFRLCVGIVEGLTDPTRGAKRREWSEWVLSHGAESSAREEDGRVKAAAAGNADALGDGAGDHPAEGSK